MSTTSRFSARAEAPAACHPAMLCAMIAKPSGDILKDRILFVTGASGRLGRVASVACARHGATVILCAKNLPSLEVIYDEIIRDGSPKPAIYAIDLNTAAEHDYDKLARTIEREFGVLHGLLHSAAAIAPLGPVSNIPVSDWSKVLNVNLNAPFILTRVLLDLLQNSGDGTIVFTSDSAARGKAAYWGAYAVSKIALEGFAAILADEFESSSKFRVNTLVPGPIDSPIRNQAFPAENPRCRAHAQSLELLYTYLLGPNSRGQNARIFEAQDYIE
ncbi:MAG: SDR family NAD(P)-dependent oxidoreductase [Methylococcales bacterium]